LYSIIEAIKIEFKQPKARLKKKHGVHLNLNKKNFISEFSQYATTPESLLQYLNKFRKAA